MLSTPNTDVNENLSLPLKFIGGFGKSTKEIGLIITSQGLYSMFVNLILFPWIVKKAGAINLWRFLGFSYPFLYLVTPYMLLLPDHLRNWALYPILIWKCTFSNLAYPACGILIANAAPSLLLLGAINGAAASSAALNRALGPTISGFIYSAGLSSGYAGLAWWCSAVISVAGAVVSTQMSGKVERDDLIDEDVLGDEEADEVQSNDNENDGDRR